MFDNFVPSVADNLEQSLRTFTDSARTLPATGVMALLFSVGLTMWSVEKAFNRIWRVPMVKPKLLRFLTYWGLLTAGSLCVVSLLALNSALSVYINLADYTPGYLDGVGLMLAPVLIEFIGFSAAYWLIPHRSVSLRYALTGGVIATILFELLKWLFAIYLQSVSFRHIYGAMAVVPITLVWLYAVWLVVLFGASLTASLASFRYRPKAVRAAKGLDFYWVLRLVVRFQQARTQRTRLTFNSLSLLEPNIAEPMITLLAFGYGLGSLLQQIEGVPYIEYLASGSICMSVMMAASFESLYSAFSRMHVQKTWESLLNTPLELDDIVLAEMLWAASKAMISGLAILLVLFALGIGLHPTTLLVPPLLLIIGVCFASIALIVNAIAKAYDFFTYYFTLVLTPMIFLSGVYYPASQLPSWLQSVASILPLGAAVRLVRPLLLGGLPEDPIRDLAILLAYIVVGFYLATVLTRRRLLK
jgi:lipooligosaccharide transport system permease protein